MPPRTLDAQTLETMISAAVAAPSIFNTQPWRFRLNTETGALEVRAAQERGLRRADPAGRALHVSVGAALFNLRVAVAHFGWEPVVRLLPDPAQPDLLAALRLGSPVGAGLHSRPDLYAAVWRRHSSRYPFSHERPPRQVLIELQEAAHAEGATLHLANGEDSARLLHVTTEAERRNSRDGPRRMESRRWIRDATGDGLAGAALGLQDATERIPIRDHAALRPATRLPSAVYERHPLIAVLLTGHDRRADWLRAGQALENVLLTATAHTVRASLFHQAIEWPDLRAALRGARQGRDHIQMLLRLGYGPAGPDTPRRSAVDVLEGTP